MYNLHIWMQKYGLEYTFCIWTSQIHSIFIHILKIINMFENSWFSIANVLKIISCVNSTLELLKSVGYKCFYYQLSDQNHFVSSSDSMPKVPPLFLWRLFAPQMATFIHPKLSHALKSNQWELKSSLKYWIKPNSYFLLWQHISFLKWNNSYAISGWGNYT